MAGDLNTAVERSMSLPGQMPEAVSHVQDLQTQIDKLNSRVADAWQKKDIPTYNRLSEELRDLMDTQDALMTPDDKAKLQGQQTNEPIPDESYKGY